MSFHPFNQDAADLHLLSQSVLSSHKIAAYIQVDWRETDTAHIFKSNLPGLKKEDVKVQVEEGRILQISGELKRDESEKNGKWLCVERRYGAFNRRFRLPLNTQVEEVKANMENGVLTVTVPKTAETKPKITTIDISEY